MPTCSRAVPLHRSLAIVAIGLISAVLMSLMITTVASAATTQFRVDARSEAGPPGLPAVDTGITLSPRQIVTISASGTAVCAEPNRADQLGCNGIDANGTGVAGAQSLAPGLPAFSLVAKIGDGPLTFVGVGPTVLSGTGQLLLGYNDERFQYFDNSGGFDVTVNIEDRQAQLEYTGPTVAVSVLSPITLSAKVTASDGDPDGGLADSRLQFTLRRLDGTEVASCTAPVVATVPGTGTGRCGVRPGGLLTLGTYRVTVELTDESPYSAPAEHVNLRLALILL